jgi:hypothetical protein
LQLGREGVGSKWLGSPYRSGRSPHWMKVKNPKDPIVRREAEEDRAWWNEQKVLALLTATILRTTAVRENGTLGHKAKPLVCLASGFAVNAKRGH